MALTLEQVERYRADGFLVVPGFASQGACDALRARFAELVDAFIPDAAPTVFSTRDHGHGRQRYFLDSADRISFFFEEEAFDAEGHLAWPKDRAINKAGHALHDLDPVFDAFSRAPALAEAARDIGFVQPLLLQSMYICKPPHIGGEVNSHQDSCFLHTEPLTATGFWFALEDATVENGCLWAERGGHRRPLHQRFVRDGDVTHLETLDPEQLPTEGLVPLEAAKGSLVILHGSLPHQSSANRSDRSRHAYTLHVIDGMARYSADNWLQRRPEHPLRGFTG